MHSDGTAYAFWCLIFLGLGGAHRIYLGKYGTGILYLLTFGLFGVGQLIDIIRIPELVEEANRKKAAQLAAAGVDAGLAAPGHGAALPGGRADLRKELVMAAAENDGTLSVTEAVAATGEDFARVEAVLKEMVRGGYVDVDNAPGTGVVIYRFTEL